MNKAIHFLAITLGALGLIDAALPGFGVSAAIVTEGATGITLAGVILLYVAHGLGVSAASVIDLADEKPASPPANPPAAQ